MLCSERSGEGPNGALKAGGRKALFLGSAELQPRPVLNILMQAGALFRPRSHSQQLCYSPLARHPLSARSRPFLPCYQHRDFAGVSVLVAVLGI